MNQSKVFINVNYAFYFHINQNVTNVCFCNNLHVNQMTVVTFLFTWTMRTFFNTSKINDKNILCICIELGIFSTLIIIKQIFYPNMAKFSKKHILLLKENQTIEWNNFLSMQLKIILLTINLNPFFTNVPTYLKVVHKLRWQVFAFFWPPMYPLTLTFSTL